MVEGRFGWDVPLIEQLEILSVKHCLCFTMDFLLDEQSMIPHFLLLRLLFLAALLLALIIYMALALTLLLHFSASHPVLQFLCALRCLLDHDSVRPVVKHKVIWVVQRQTCTLVLFVPVSFDLVLVLVVVVSLP